MPQAARRGGCGVASDPPVLKQAPLIPAQAGIQGPRTGSPLSRGRARVSAAIVAVGLFAAMLSVPAHAAPRACEFYRALERRCHCPAVNNYFGDYGRKYCERFMQSAGWSPAGLRWRDRAAACLRAELNGFLARARGCSCAEVKAFAFDSHARCYTQLPASACRLPLSDIAHIYSLVDAADLFDPLGMRQSLAITLTCACQNGNAGAVPDDRGGR